MSVSIYIHIPFCASKCAYCDFYSSPASDSVKAAYTAALVHSISDSEKTGDRVSSVYFGGGTPTVLTSNQLSNIVEALDKKFNISDAERTLEVNPDSVKNAKIFGSLGFNRFSMGVQSFNDFELRLAGRRHNSEQAVKAYEYLRTFADNVNLDLMLGFPSENHPEHFRESLSKLISLNPEHVSVYMLKYESGTPFYELSDKALPDDIISDLYLYASEVLEKYGYEHYEISNFAQNGFRSAHNISYWNRGRYLAFGPGAYGFDGKVRWHYEKNTADFIARNGDVRKIVDEIQDEDAMFSEKIILGLRMSDGIDEKTYKTVVSDSKKKKLCENLILTGLAKKTSAGGFALTAEGWLVSNTVIEKLM